ncbi:MAG: hypothetical protein IPJ06_19930 [Saprospiraceae bacterium]|nr:hypothetical protein [Saprospiraceae bacterium]
MTEHLHLHRTADQGAVKPEKRTSGWPDWGAFSKKKILGIYLEKDVIVEWGLRSSLRLKSNLMRLAR